MNEHPQTESESPEARWYLPTWGERLTLMGWRVIYFAPAVLLLAFLVSYFHAWEHHYSAAILAGTALLVPGRGAIPEERRPVVLLLLAWLALPTLYAFTPEQWSAGTWIAMSLWKGLPLAGLVALALTRASDSRLPTPDSGLRT